MMALLNASPVAWGQMLTILIMAVALGFDAFSLGIGIGMRGIRYRHILKISIVIGLFHIVMPLLGMYAGSYLGVLLGHVAVAAGGGLLILLGSHMVYSSVRGEDSAAFNHNTFWGMILFALSVSVDSFSVGVSLGIFATDIVMTVLLFGLLGGGMSILGLVLGRHVGSWIGEYGEALGGVILFLFGLKFLL
ncbi:manganese efflux pump [Paenibacillus sp. FJAT-26967]|uniref:manganese efflux pump MntP n=1 Tax=Paenibacillus sp. FJAT-26967 TaxID=1729690 RepID=UPI000838783A|nr:manganese efflux pump [Paenibacillus sp. FJAT-26967]